QELDEHGIERGACVLVQQRDGLRLAARWPVRAISLQRAETVGDREHASAEGDVLAAQPGGIAKTIPSLVMAQHQVADRAGKRDVLENLRAYARVNFDAVELFRRQRVRLGE